MVITEHLFGLIQCYSEVGVCSIGDHNFNIMLMTPLYMLIALVIVSLLMFLWIKFRGCR
jgi:hypothetical protein